MGASFLKAVNLFSPEFPNGSVRENSRPLVVAVTTFSILSIQLNSEELGKLLGFEIQPWDATDSAGIMAV